MERSIFRTIYEHYFTDNVSCREDMDIETERKWVSDMFDAYEQTGFVDTFSTPFDLNHGQEKYVGQKFKVVRRLEEGKDPWDLCCLPAWVIKFDNGDTLEAYPEEICKAEKEEL